MFEYYAELCWWPQQTYSISSSCYACAADVNRGALLPPADCGVCILEAVAWASAYRPHRDNVTSFPRRQRYLHMDPGFGIQCHRGLSTSHADQGEKSQRPQASHIFVGTRRQHLRLQGDRFRQHAEHYLGYCDRCSQCHAITTFHLHISLPPLACACRNKTTRSHRY